MRELIHRNIIFQRAEGGDSGSETEEEEMDVSGEGEAGESTKQKDDSTVVCTPDEGEDYASDASSDILQPTQV